MDDYSIWVLEYCYREKHPVGSVLYGHFNAGTLRLPFSYLLVRGNRLNILDQMFARDRGDPSRGMQDHEDCAG
jgi:hypothetical protein